MSFNIRYDRSATSTEPGDPDHWPDRRPLVIDLLKKERPMILGIQEGLYQQLSAIDEALPGHRMLGYGRKGGSVEEYSAIYYDADLFEALAWDQFWLSDTPREIGSTSWGNSVTRIVVWVKLRQRRSGKEFIVVNTHFDHQSDPARVKSAQAIVDLIGGEDLAGLPVVLTGDFNSTAKDSGAYTQLVSDGPLVDTWDEAGKRLTPEWGTFPNYQDPIEGEKRIDWILTSPDVTTLEVGINTSRDRDGSWPSDHTPVQALVALP